MRFADLDAVTLDAHGTLLTLADPVPELRRALRASGVGRTAPAIADAFAEEAAFYTPRSLQGRDEASLARLRAECAAVFLSSLRVRLDPAAFAPAFVAALRFRPLPGVRERMAELQARGLALAVVSNWDYALGEHLASVGLARYLAAVVTSAEAGAAKPEPRIFATALRRLGVVAGRTLHVGDDAVDETGARAAGLRFARAPLETAVGALA